MIVVKLPQMFVELEAVPDFFGSFLFIQGFEFPVNPLHDVHVQRASWMFKLQAISDLLVLTKPSIYFYA